MSKQTNKLAALSIINMLDAIRVKQVDLAKEIGVEPMAISKMKKKSPQRFELLMDGMRAKKLREEAMDLITARRES